MRFFCKVIHFDSIQHTLSYLYEAHSVSRMKAIMGVKVSVGRLAALWAVTGGCCKAVVQAS